MEQPNRSALENYVHRTQEMGTWVLINADWYKTASEGSLITRILSALHDPAANAALFKFSTGLFR